MHRALTPQGLTTGFRGVWSLVPGADKEKKNNFDNFDSELKSYTDLICLSHYS